MESVKTGGVNLIDTAQIFRYMKSERTLGAALRFLVEKEKIMRNELFIISKGGYLSVDADQGISTITLKDKLINQMKIITEDDIYGDCYCIHPAYLKYSL